MLHRILLGGSGDSAFQASLGDGDALYTGEAFSYGQPLHVDASGDYSLCMAQNDFTNGIGPFVVTRFGSADTSQVNKRINVSLRGQTMTRDSAGNYYIACNANSSAFYLFKLDSTGALLWQRTITTPTSTVYVAGIRVDSTDSNVFICGTRSVSAQSYGFVCKITSAGAHSFSRTSSTASTFHSMAIDSSNNVYCVGYYTPSGGVLVMKFTSTGTTSFTRRYYLSSGSGSSLGYGYSIACDNSFIYVTGSFGNSNYPHVMKMNLTGVIQWSRYANIVPSLVQAGIAVGLDSSGNIYMGAGNAADSGPKCGLFKFDSSGTLQWQRDITQYINMGVMGETIMVKGGNIYFVGTNFNSFLGQNGGWLMKVPADGSRTNGSLYLPSSYTVGAAPATINQAAVTLTISTTAYTVTTPTTFTSTNDNMYINKLTNL